MHATLVHLALLGTAAALPKIPFLSTTDVIPLRDSPVSVTGASTSKRQSQACFIVGDEELPEETAEVADSLASSVTCDNSATTLSGVPDVTAGTMTFSAIDFSQSGQSGLEFALDEFVTADDLAQSNLQAFQDALDVYVATEAGVRSVGGELSIKVPKFFLEMQISRIQTAQGNPPTDAGLQVDHLRDKVLSNAAGEDQALLDQVTQLATQVA